LFVIELPFFLFLDLLVQFVFALPECSDFLVLIFENLVETDELLVDEGQFVFVIVDEVFAVPKLHDGDLVFLAFLLVVFDLPVAVLEQFTALSDLVL
jgi:hypothetical protein